MKEKHFTTVFPVPMLNGGGRGNLGKIARKSIAAVAVAVAFALPLTSANLQAQGFFRNCDPCEPVTCDPCDPCGDYNCAPVRAGKWFVNGHMEAGFFANSHGNKSTYGVPDSYAGGSHSSYAGLFRGADWHSGNTDFLQNTRLTGAQVNQVYISTGRAVDGRRGLDIGGTVDFTWGSDAYMTQARGMEFATGHWTESGLSQGQWGTGDYFSSFAQAYAEIALDRWNVKVGKFYAPFGSDSYKSTENFFYSWSHNAYIAPTTVGGVLATFNVNNQLSVFGGWANGVDQIGETSDDNAFLGGFNFSPSKRFNLRYAFGVGKDTYGYGLIKDAREGGDNVKRDYFVQSLTATSQLTNRLKYVFDWTYNQSRTKADGAVLSNDDIPFDLVGTWYAYGINNEIIFQANQRWAFGTRFGMYRPYAIDGLLQDSKFEMSTVGLGANWTPNKWLLVKPELRYDWVNRGENRTVFNGLTNTYQLSGGLSAVVKF